MAGHHIWNCMYIQFAESVSGSSAAGLGEKKKKKRKKKEEEAHTEKNWRLP